MLSLTNSTATLVRSGLRSGVELGVSDYQFVRRYLERSQQAL